MTATPRYFTGRVVREAKEADFEVASMDNEQVFGKVFHRLGFAEAIDRDLLTDYQVVVGVDDATYRDWPQRGRFVTLDGTEVTDARTLAGQIGLAEAMRRYDLHRTITFHSQVKRAEEFARSLPEVIAWMPARQRPTGHLWSDYASGEMPAGQRHALLQHLGRLDHGEQGLLANARCLAQGVDVPTLDSVAFVDPRRSEVDIVQAVGRAIRLARHKTVGTIVIPVFIDTDDDPAVAPPTELSSEFIELPGWTWNPHTAGWEDGYSRLLHYVEHNGDARVPQSHILDGYPLGQWVIVQRNSHGKGTLDADRQRRLQDFPVGDGTPRPTSGGRASVDSRNTLKATAMPVSHGLARWMATGSVHGSRCSAATTPKAPWTPTANADSRVCPAGHGTRSPTSGRRVSVD